MITWVVLTDGRDYIFDTLPKWQSKLSGPITHKVIIDDSGDNDHRVKIKNAFPDFAVIPVGTERQGYIAAMEKVMEIISYNQYGFLLEDDFIPNQFINLENLVSILESDPSLAQVVLKRQPWYGNETAAGMDGMLVALENNGHVFEEHKTNHWTWQKHQAMWSCNPCLFNKEIASRPWPRESWSESKFGTALFKDGFYCAMLGDRSDEPQVTHIGYTKKGTNY